MKRLLILLAFALPICLFAQEPQATSAEDRLAGFEQRKNLTNNSLIAEIPFSNIGPSVFGGRVVDLAVSPTNANEFYVAYASGGLWYTKNNGTTLTPLFENEAVMSIGDIAVNWNKTPHEIWIGTGENNSSRSSYSGLGMYHSADGGKSWTHKGLPESHHIGRIILHPTNPQVIWVAALGHLYSANEERGIYKSSDAGGTWKKVFYSNENAGGVDLVIDPTNPDVLYGATWERTRRSWNFTESGPGSVLVKSTDGGDSWNVLSTDKSGFPTGNGVGRIGLDISSDGKHIYAILDNYDRRPEEKKKKADREVLTKDALRSMSSAEFSKLSEKKIGQYLRSNRFPKKYSAKKVKEMVLTEKIQPSALVEFTEDANSLLFDTPVIGAEVYHSSNGGVNWTKTHEGYLDDIYYSYGYYFGQIRVAPYDRNELYIMGVPILKSTDAGATWENVNGNNVHVDHHALWINPGVPGHLILGNDGGVVITYDYGENWIKQNPLSMGQFYYVNVDNEKPYNVYGGTQDNGVWKGPSTYNAGVGWQMRGDYPYETIMGGDGMQVQIDPRNTDIVYTGYQFGNYSRIDLSEYDYTSIGPEHELGDRPLRFNWQTPILLSQHNPDILYMGSNKLHRSFNQGDDFTALSDDLTQGGRKGDVPYGTLTTISESKFSFGLLYVGTDDGKLYRSDDGGHNFIDISRGLPSNLWVSRIYASHHEENRVYASLNGYRWDDFKAYVYRSDDRGKTWSNIGRSLPAEPVNVVKEDPSNENLIYVGTDHGLYASLDGGASFMAMKNGLPAVPVHDVVVQEREKDLIVGTHGRSIYKADIAHLQNLTSDITSKSLAMFELKSIRHSSRWGNSWSKWRTPPVPKMYIAVFSKNAGPAVVKVSTEKDLVLHEKTVNLKRGLNYVEYDLSYSKKMVKKLVRERAANSKDGKEENLEAAKNEMYYLPVGTYSIKVTAAGNSDEQNLEIKGR